MGAQTDEILKEIKNGTSNENNVNFIDENAIRQEIREKLNANHESLNKFASECNIHASHLSDFFNYGKNLGRNKLLAVLINLEYDFDTVQSMLQRLGVSALYPRNKRDYLIAVSIRNKKNLDEIEEILSANNFESIMFSSK